LVHFFCGLTKEVVLAAAAAKQLKMKLIRLVQKK